MNADAYRYIMNLNEEYFDNLRDQYVPDMGAAETIGGEILRAMDRLIYRFFNDGDMVGRDYGNETCNSSYRYLFRHIERCPELHNAWNEDEYTDMLAALCDEVKAFFKSHPDVFTWDNDEDSRTPSDEDRNWDKEDWDEEDW